MMSLAVWACCVALATGYLLPGDVAPLHYDLVMAYDIDPATNYSYYGLAVIQLIAKEPTSKIVLHAQDFSISKDKISLIGVGRAPQVTGVSFNDSLNFMILELDDDLQENANYTLTLPFYGNLKQGLEGVYISSYVTKETKIKEYLVATQFEAISARKGFPCFDEPMYKATFRITLGHHQGYSAVSNMPLRSSSEENALERFWPWAEIEQTFGKQQSDFVFDEFMVSVPMSTYLVAFVISNFSHVESPKELSTTQFRIWARADAIDQTAYAATVGPKVLTYFEKFFNVSFPLPKQDMMAIPDFSAGAMENWGLITYRETALLYDKEQSSFTNKERVAEVIAHELAHQWFGNLVTMKWWSDLWLNEGFATYVASIGVSHVEPNWEADRNYAVANLLSVLNLDSLESSHPVSIPLDDPKRISEIFDEISYRKGSTLIRMMTMFLGEDVFRNALNKYLIKYSYKNAAQDDLWAELTAASQRLGAALARGVSVKTVMDTWTTQTGYPLLTVVRDYSGNTVTVTQKRYLNTGARSSTATSWWVPLTVACEGESIQQPLQWLAADEGVTQAHRFQHAAKPNQWLLFNADMIAPYRVNYDARNWRQLSEALKKPGYGGIGALGRVQLLSDAFALAWTSRLDYSTALQLISYLQNEREYLPLEMALSALAKIENVLKRTPDYGAYQKFARRLIGDAYRRSGGLAVKRIVDGENLNSVKTQVLLSSWACRMQVPGCEENAMQLFDQWMEMGDPDANNPIPLDLRRTVYCVALKRGGVKHWRFALARKQAANVAAAKEALLYALACTREVWVQAQYLEWAVTDGQGSEVRAQDAGGVIMTVLRSTGGYYIAKDFIYDRVGDIFARFNGQGRRLGGIIKSLLDQFTTQRELDEFLAWREKHQKYLEEAKFGVNQAIEKARVNIAWLAKNRAEVVQQLRDFSA